MNFVTNFRCFSRFWNRPANALTADRGDGGWALVSTLGVVLLLSILALAAQQRIASAYRAERLATARAQADAILEAGVTRAVLGLLDGNVRARWTGDGSTHRVDFEGNALEVAVQDENGKIDLNASEVSTLRRLFRSVGLNEENSETIADRIADWRSPPGLKHLNGTTDEDYASSGYAWHPRHGPFQSVDELQLVMGMTADIFSRVQPALTVYTRRAIIDPAVAPKEVLRTLPGYDEAQIASILAERGSRLDTSAAGPPSAIVSVPGMASHIFSVSIRTPVARRQYSEVAVIELTDSGEHFFRLR